jgi:pimeloyl-ACP methyl ester carboxylesterase
MTSTDIHTAQSDNGAKDARHANGPMVRVVLASLATGIVGALLMTLGVFAGGEEHAITGSALLAFGLSWAMLSSLTSRFTTQPQHWARVPAATMAVTGLGLLIVAPGERALTESGWVWPPVMIALAFWSVLRVREAMTSRARWAVYAVMGGLAVASVGGWAETVALAHDDGVLVMPGRTYDIGGRSLHLTCAGTGSPIVVLVSGTGSMSSSWARIMPGVATRTRVCAYDRAGQGWSDDAPHPQDGAEMAADLHQLLAVAGEHGPYLLAGHSLGGVYSLDFTAKYPADVAGLVLLDSSSPEQFTAMPDFKGQYEMIRRAYSVAPSVARLGLGRLVSSSMFSNLPEPAAGQVRAFETSSRGLENARDEIARYRDAMRQAREVTSLGGKPLVVVTATVGESKGWAAAQEKLAALSTDAVHLTATASHEGVLDSERGVASAVDGIVRALTAVRTGRSVATTPAT